MATQPKKLTLKEEIRAQKLRIMELKNQYITMLYFETMPDYDPYYKYCYQSSNFTIPGLMQSVDAWLRAVIMHMSQRRPGHGGGYTKAIVITPQAFTTENARDNCEDKAYWLRDVPTNVAFRVGYEIIPGLRALEFDGVPRAQSEYAARLIESAIPSRLVQWDQLRNTYKNRITSEYARMRIGQSNALLVVGDALSLIETAVKLLPSNIQNEV